MYFPDALEITVVLIVVMEPLNTILSEEVPELNRSVSAHTSQLFLAFYTHNVGCISTTL